MNNRYKSMIVGLTVSLGSLFGMHDSNDIKNNLVECIQRIPKNDRTKIVNLLASYVYNTIDYERLKKPKASFCCTHKVASIAVSANGSYVVTGLQNGEVILWNSDGTPIRTVCKYKEMVDLVAIDDESAIIATGTTHYGGSILVWDMTTGEQLWDMGKNFWGWGRHAFKVDVRNKSLLLSHPASSKYKYVIDLFTGQERGRIPGGLATSDVKSLSHLFSIELIRNSLIIDTMDQKLVQLKAVSGSDYVALSSDDTHIVNASPFNTQVKIWNISSLTRTIKLAFFLKQLYPQDYDRPGYPALRLFFCAKLQSAQEKGEKLVLYCPSQTKKGGFLWYIYQYCLNDLMRYFLRESVSIVSIDSWSDTKKENIISLFHLHGEKKKESLLKKQHEQSHDDYEDSDSCEDSDSSNEN